MIFFRSYFYPYKLSYLYAVVVGFLVTFVVGYLLSYILRLMNKQGEERIYLDGEKIRINPDLFTPPKAHFIRLRNQIEEKRHEQVTKF